MSEVQAECNRISWFFTACVEQFRFVSNENKRLMKIPAFFHSHSFMEYQQHFMLSLRLLKQGEKMWAFFLKSPHKQGGYLQNIYLLYVKRSIFQLHLGLEDLFSLIKEVPLKQDPLYQGLVKKVKNLLEIASQLERGILQIQSFF